MLSIYFLNVRHGDSMVIEYVSDDGNKHYGVIDSNIPPGSTDPPALDILKQLGANRISFIMITHPDIDHFRGIYKIMEYFRNNIDSFYSFPIGRHIKSDAKKLKKYAEEYAKQIKGTDSPLIKSASKEFIKILIEIKDNIGIENWYDETGYCNDIFPRGFNDVIFKILLPDSTTKSYIFNAIQSDNGLIDEPKERNNEISVALLVEYKNHRIILGGDAPNKKWLLHQNYLSKQGKKLDASAIKLPHHGSKEGCSLESLQYIAGERAERVYGIISANGVSHPHFDTIKNCQETNIGPYCTNLSKHCRPLIREVYPEIDPELSRTVRLYEEDLTENNIAPCQGNITLNIDNFIGIDRQYENLCLYRGEFDSIVL